MKIQSRTLLSTWILLHWIEIMWGVAALRTSNRVIKEQLQKDFDAFVANGIPVDLTFGQGTHVLGV